MPSVEKLSTGSLNYEWAEGWIRDMKRIGELAPGTIRHRHGALARCFDWMPRKHPEIMAQNPLRLLKRGFATYTDADADLLAKKGLEPRIDEERDRRLAPEEELRIRRRLHGKADELMLFELALQTAMRLRECYTLHVSQLNLGQRTIFLERTKNGSSCQVPLPTPMMHLLSAYTKSRQLAITARQGRLLPFGSGDDSGETLIATTANLSARFARIFMQAGAADFRFNDLRHEATCRLYEKTKLSDVQIARITGRLSTWAYRRFAS
jgi:integrase